MPKLKHKIKVKIEELINPQMLESAVSTISKGADIFMKLGLAYVGYKAFNHWSGALTALLGLHMAKSRNIPAGAAGVAVLTALGMGAASKSWVFQNDHRQPGLKE